ncbi:MULTISPECIES: thiopeptide-type bacteriocin biosynthesis protein [unclassified Streptomyces]|uniref:thiopeptide-type bacteriocin biosynthesis protein n=1 Tax=unclassified Streptomyces TaxID=2593676 RepID=UPI002DD91421|nr:MULTISPECIES: thiopeptide-type bacteriocin biosynthesis protein [unclassified Streptomyces]WSA91650.1 thiopeptide-type bacteriocin biosynthesis protein [Streptomyces sp. NBC_01795]WSB76022.1 thiopeptide-type bacteriocin biosynthesis protein [Streptomyces sp. NBC_01775]WSS15704.1 thiopeptide-type bacteriocin biosynthesis protein [Streptomyces sp. NBC_01186]WSS44544.1 thiopeptide-type bacteriocin biosynthesis protein [Streptomyces sp. NBC_01187]
MSRAVLDVLAGEPLEAVAHRIGIPPVRLADARDIFQRAGHEALVCPATQTDWWQVHIEFADWGSAERTVATHLVPLLAAGEENGAATEWWFTRKYPSWRLRVRPESRATTGLRARLDQLVTTGHLLRWWRGIYEPETAAFGGPPSMLAAHDLFTVDSRQILALGTGPGLGLGHRELSILLCTIMMRAAGLEWYEQGDVWQRVIGEEHRSALENVPNSRLYEMAGQIRTLLTADTRADGPILGPHGPLENCTDWAAAFHRTGLALKEAAGSGTLDRGLRRVLSLHVIFHWNRLGLSIGAQSALAWAARTAILDPPIWTLQHQ